MKSTIGTARHPRPIAFSSVRYASLFFDLEVFQ